MEDIDFSLASAFSESRRRNVTSSGMDCRVRESLGMTTNYPRINYYPPSKNCQGMPRSLIPLASVDPADPFSIRPSVARIL